MRYLVKKQSKYPVNEEWFEGGITMQVIKLVKGMIKSNDIYICQDFSKLRA